MSNEMLWLIDVYEKYCKQNQLPHMCASDLLYGADTRDTLNRNQQVWLERFISIWDIVNQNS
tara:strand:- start:578 stop:763 length:186 start_codon:yes stop_codon:yes gene_type:complete